MSVDNCTFKKDATGVSITGGTDIIFTQIGSDIANGIVVVNAAQADFRIRESITFRNRNPTKDRNGSWSKAKRSSLILCPMLLASGDIAYNLGRVDFEIHPEATSAHIANLRYLTSQLTSSAEVTNFLTAGSLR